MIKTDRGAVLRGEDLDIYLKSDQYYLDNKLEVQIVKHIQFGKVAAIIEREGRCYVSMPLNEYGITGMLYETRDSFDELVAKYPPEDDKAGGNASEKKE